MRKLAVNQPARGEECYYQRGTEEKSQQVVRNACCFHFVNLTRDRLEPLPQKSLPQASHISNERVDFLFRKFFAIGGHLAFAVHD